MKTLQPILTEAAQRKMLAAQRKHSLAASKAPLQDWINQMRRNGSTPRPNPFLPGPNAKQD